MTIVITISEQQSLSEWWLKLIWYILEKAKSLIVNKAILSTV